MKKLLMLAVVLLGVATMAQAQEREKRILDLKNGQEVKGYVMRQPDGSWMVETESGDILFYTIDEVVNLRKEGEKKVLIKNEGNDSRDSKGNYCHLYRKGGKLIDYSTNIEVNSLHLSGDTYDKYRKKKAYYTTGIWLVSASSVVMATGLGFIISSGEALSYSEEAFRKNYADERLLRRLSIGEALEIVGAPFLVWGIVDLCVGIAGLDKIAKEYNVGYADNVKISFGAQQYGYGLAIKF